MLSIEMYVPIVSPFKEKEELDNHPLLRKFPNVTWSKDCECLGHIHVMMDDAYEYMFREECMRHDLMIVGDTRK